VLTRRRDRTSTAGDVVDMRRAIALEKGEGDVWDLKYAAGGMVRYRISSLNISAWSAADKPDISDVTHCMCSTTPPRLGVLPQSAAQVLRPAARLYHDLTQFCGSASARDSGGNIRRGSVGG